MTKDVRLRRMLSKYLNTLYRQRLGFVELYTSLDEKVEKSVDNTLELRYYSGEIANLGVTIEDLENILKIR